jgi:hypothetical protein
MGNPLEGKMDRRRPPTGANADRNSGNGWRYKLVEKRAEKRVEQHPGCTHGRLAIRRLDDNGDAKLIEAAHTHARTSTHASVNARPAPAQAQTPEPATRTSTDAALHPEAGSQSKP